MNIAIIKCNCHSYNKDDPGSGKDQEVIIRRPENLGQKDICIDFCIVNVIKHLWACGVNTQGSCCGHGRIKPSIVLDNSVSAGHYLRVKNIISEVDGRDFDILSWKLVNMGVHND